VAQASKHVPGTLKSGLERCGSGESVVRSLWVANSHLLWCHSLWLRPWRARTLAHNSPLTVGGVL